MGLGSSGEPAGAGVGPLCRGLRCVSSSVDPAVSRGPRPPFPRRGLGLRAWRPRRAPSWAGPGGAAPGGRRSEGAGRSAGGGDGDSRARRVLAGSLLGGKRYQPATEAALPGASHAPARRRRRETGAFRVLQGQPYFRRSRRKDLPSAFQMAWCPPSS